MKRYLLFLLAASAAWAVPSFQYSPVVDMQTAGSARIYFSSNASALATVEYGNTAAYGLTLGLNGGITGTLWIANLTALTPSTTFHYRVCLNDGTTTCSSDATFSTLAQGSTTPTLPTAQVDVSMPIQTGTVRTVAANCSDFASIYSASTWGDVIEVPPGADCQSQYAMAGKTHGAFDGWIVVRPTTYLSLPPLGTRITPADVSNMFTLRHNGPNIYDGDTSPTGGTVATSVCDSGAMWVRRHDSETAWNLFQCQPTVTGSITGVVYVAQGNTGDTVRLTVTAHGQTVGRKFRISGATSTSGTLAALLNGGGVVTGVPDANTLTVTVYRTNSAAAADSYVGSGSAGFLYYSAVTHSSGTGDPVGACTAGAWYYDTAAATSEFIRDRAMSYCGSDLAWHKFNLHAAQVPLLDLTTARYVRIIGARFTHLAPYVDPLLDADSGAQPHVNFWGRSMSSFVSESTDTDHVILDRCWWDGWDYPARVNLAMEMRGSHVAVIESRLSGWSWWKSGTDFAYTMDSDYESGGIFPQAGPGVGLIRNNHLEAYGITVHFDDSALQNTPTADNYTILRNFFYRNPTHFYNHVSSDGHVYLMRHFLEWKGGHNQWVKGNRFSGNWRTLNRGEAIAAGIRSGTGAYVSTADSGGTITSLRGAHFLVPGDLVTFDGISIRTVLTAPSSTTCTISGTVANGTHYLNKINHSNSIGNLTIESNVFHDVPNVFAGFGTQDYTVMQGPVLNKIRFANNLAYNIDQGLGIVAGGAGEGSFALLYLGVEDVTATHNTVVCATGGTCREPFLGASDISGITGLIKAKGFVAQNNLLYAGVTSYTANGNNGTTGLAYTYPLGYTYSGNVLFGPGAVPSLTPAGNTWRNTTASGAVPWDVTGTITGYRLTAAYRSVDTCTAVPGDCTADGLTAGIDRDALDAAFAIAPPVATTMTLLSGNSQSAAAGASFSSGLAVEVRDQYSAVMSGVSVTFTAPSSGALATLSGSNTAVVATNGSGVATSPIPLAGAIVGGYSVVATAGALTPVSFTLTNLLGVAPRRAGGRVSSGGRIAR